MVKKWGSTPAKRVTIGLLLLAAFTLIWADLAVGVFNTLGVSGN